MLRALVEAGQHFRAEEVSLPLGYTNKHVTWIIDLLPNGTYAVLGPYKPGDIDEFAAPSRQRSGKVGPNNLKPYLLVDDGMYVFGLSEPGKESESQLAHEAYTQLLRDAARVTSDDRLSLIVAFLDQPVPADIRAAIPPKNQWIASRVDGDRLVDQPSAQDYWAQHLAGKLLTATESECCCCGAYKKIVRTLPGEVVILGQKCQITSFNETAYTSFGKPQTTNAPLCFSCASHAIHALQHFVEDPRHRAVVQRDRSKSAQQNPLKNQLAVFWLKEPLVAPIGDEIIELTAPLAALIEGAALASGPSDPAPEIGQVRTLIDAPWKPRRSATRISDNAFYLAILSANKARLVVRDWLDITIERLLANVHAYLDAVNVVDPYGRAGPVAIQAMAAAAEIDDPNLARGVVRTAFAGHPPPAVLRDAATRRMRVPAVRREPTPDMRPREREYQIRRLHALAAALKLGLVYGKEDRVVMAELDPRHEDPAYLCGRLLAVLEQIQRCAATGKLNTTVVDTYYGSASTVPASVFGVLVNRATKAHMAKIRREQRGYTALEEELETIMSAIDGAGGFPPPLSMPDQAEFALGFYQQRAAYRARHNG
jgi:CRISPR-associated protein Csd1